VQTSDGGYIASGNRFDMSIYYTNSWILKLSSSGEIVWAKGLKGSKWAFVNQLHPDSDGKCLATGFLYDRDSGIARGWFFQLGGNGNILWQKVTSGNGWGHLSSVQKTRDGGYIGAGSVYLSTSIGSSAWIIKTDASGQIQWQKVYGGFESDYALSIHQTSDRGYIVSGRTNSFTPRTGAIWVFKLNPTGNIGWQRAYSNFKTQLNPWCRQTDDGGYFIALKNHMPFYTAVEPHLWVFKTDEKGLIENCPLGELTHAKPSTPTIAFQDSHVETNDIELEAERIPLLMEDASIIETELCWQAAERPFEVIDWLNRARICMDWPSGVGVGVPGRCAPRNDCFLCPYYLTNAQLSKKIPDFLINIYSELSLISSGIVYGTDSKVALKQLAKHFEKTTSGPFYTEALKTTIIEKLKRSTNINPQLLGSVAEGINAMELDLIPPADSTAKVEAGDYSSVDLNGIALTVFHNVETSGTVSLKLKSGLPAFAKGMHPAWPIFSYEIEFSGKLVKDGFLDISFFIDGISLAGRISDLRLLEWDGRTYRDITTHVDSARGIITGRTARPATYVFMNPRSFNKPLLPSSNQITVMP
jgi:hypothetical protein